MRVSPLLKFSVATPILFGALSLAQAQAQDFMPSMAELERVNRQGKTTWIVDVENDSLLLKRDDGFYTSGNHLQRQTLLKTDQGAVVYRWTLGQDLYTASDIKIRPQNLSRFDHPYAGWLYAGLNKEIFSADGTMKSIGFDVGCLGPCAGGEWTQKNLHRLLNQPLPQAWSTQLKQEWGTVLKASYAPAPLSLTSNVDLQSRYSARLGNIFSDASVDVIARFGLLSLSPGDSANFVKARIGARAVAYNATIQGGYFRDQVLAVSPKRLVPEVELAYVFQDQSWNVTCAVIRRGNEIEQLSNAKGAQNFAKISLGYAF